MEFRDCLSAAGVDPKQVKILRHTLSDGRTPHDCWRHDPDVFWKWVSFQKIRNRSWFARPIWANFVALPDGSTLFVGLTAAEMEGQVPDGEWDALRRRPMPSGLHDVYKLEHLEQMRADVGRLFVQWPPGRNWTRCAERGSYPVC